MGSSGITRDQFKQAAEQAYRHPETGRPAIGNKVHDRLDAAFGELDVNRDGVISVDDVAAAKARKAAVDPADEDALLTIADRELRIDKNPEVAKTAFEVGLGLMGSGVSVDASDQVADAAWNLAAIYQTKGEFKKAGDLLDRVRRDADGEMRVDPEMHAAYAGFRYMELLQLSQEMRATATPTKAQLDLRTFLMGAIMDGHNDTLDTIKDKYSQMSPQERAAATAQGGVLCAAYDEAKEAVRKTYELLPNDSAMAAFLEKAADFQTWGHIAKGSGLTAWLQ